MVPFQTSSGTFGLPCLSYVGESIWAVHGAVSPNLIVQRHEVKEDLHPPSSIPEPWVEKLPQASKTNIVFLKCGRGAQGEGCMVAMEISGVLHKSEMNPHHFCGRCDKRDPRRM
ncbi:hypothetical protein JZ751_005523, partial [Albula glossodonta]